MYSLHYKNLHLRLKLLYYLATSCLSDSKESVTLALRKYRREELSQTPCFLHPVILSDPI